MQRLSGAPRRTSAAVGRARPRRPVSPSCPERGALVASGTASLPVTRERLPCARTPQRLLLRLLFSNASSVAAPAYTYGGTTEQLKKRTTRIPILFGNILRLGTRQRQRR